MTLVVELGGAALTYPGPPPVTALHQCDLTVSRGEYVSVVGPSGSGKSTFLNVVGLLDRPTSGRYLLDGIDTGQLSEGDRSSLRGSRIGFVFQSFHLMPHRSALENVMLPLVYRRDMARLSRVGSAAEALDWVGLTHRSHALPSQLSGGERQRVAIARALAAAPSLLLCDEPTGNLDTHTTEVILSLLDELHNSGITILIITHDPGVADRTERTITIRDGVLSTTVTSTA